MTRQAKKKEGKPECDNEATDIGFILIARARS